MNEQNDKKTEALTICWTNAQPAISAFVSSMVPNFQDADDIVQKVAVTTVKKFDEYDESKSFVAWAIGIAKKEILNYRRTNSKDRRILDVETIQHITEVYEKEISKLDDIKKALQFCISKVRGHWRQVVEMRYLRELSPKRIAQQLGMTTNAVFITLHRARIALRECINRRMSEMERS